jgi:hypothetical protein
MARYVVIAARTRSDLYGYLQRQFAENGDAQVLLDRRHEERRRREETYDFDRRRGERRSPRGRDPGLHYHGFLVVRQDSQGSEIKMQWRPPWWESGVSGEPVALEKRQWPGETHVIENRERVTVWVTEGQRLLSLGSKLLVEYGQITARAETAERKCERLEEEVKNLRTENERFRRERRQFVETVKGLARKLAGSTDATS